MRTPDYIKLEQKQKDQIEKALRKEFPSGPAIQVNADQVLAYRDGLIVSVHPETYPEERFAFMQGVASAEIELKDAGLNVRLQPVVPQRMLVIGTPPNTRAIAYLSSDGSEYADMAALLKVKESEISAMAFTGFAYDNDDDLRLALKEAKQEYPDADFSRIRIASTKTA